MRDAEKLAANQQISDLIQALGCGTRSNFRDDDLRYDRIIIMTDADVDGAHIASLLITFFLSGNAGYDPCRSPVSGNPAALPDFARWQDALCP